MNQSSNPKLQSPWRRAIHSKHLLAAPLLLALVAGAHAASVPAQFDVMIQLTAASSRPQTGSCAPALGAMPTIVCETRLTSSALPIASSAGLTARLGGGYRFISYASGLPGSLDIYTGAGTSTAFRLVNWADREYIEMTVGW
jgi:hypothetical protein